jgi:hypothetical protein
MAIISRTMSAQNEGNSCANLAASFRPALPTSPKTGIIPADRAHQPKQRAMPTIISRTTNPARVGPFHDGSRLHRVDGFSLWPIKWFAAGAVIARWVNYVVRIRALASEHLPGLAGLNGSSIACGKTLDQQRRAPFDNERQTDRRG